MGDLCTLIIVTNAESALGANSMGPEATKLNAALWEFGVREKKPEPENWLREDVKDSISNNLLVDAEDAGSIGNTPNNWVGSPDENRVKGNSSKEFANFVSLGLGCETSVDNELIDNNKEGNASHGVPAPLVSPGTTVGSEQTSQDHDEISNNCNEDVCSVQSSKKRQVEKEERGGQAPVDVTGPIDLTIDVVVSVWDSMLMSLRLVGVVPVDAALGGHGVVGDGSNDCDQSGDDVVDTTAHWNSP